MPISDKLPLTEKDKHSHLQARGEIINKEKETGKRGRERQPLNSSWRKVHIILLLCNQKPLCNGTFNSFTLRMEKSTEANKSLMYLLAFWRAVGHNTPYGNPCHRSRRRASRPGSTHTQRNVSDTQKIRCHLHNTSKQNPAVKVSEHKQRSDTIKDVSWNWAKAISAFEKKLTAFFPWIWQELHVLHSMHCHRRALTFAVKSTENFRHDGWPLRRNVE